MMRSDQASATGRCAGPSRGPGGPVALPATDTVRIKTRDLEGEDDSNRSGSRAGRNLIAVIGMARAAPGKRVDMRRGIR